MQWISFFVVTSYLLAVVLIANQLDSKRFMRKQQLVLAYPYRYEDAQSQLIDTQAEKSGLTGLLTFMLFGILCLLLLSVLSALLSAVSPELAETSVSLPNTLLVSVIGISVTALCGAVILMRSVRVWISERLGSHGTFNPDSSVHKTAFVLALAILAYTSMEIIMVGGVAGMAENLQEQTPGATDAVANLLLMVMIAFVGVGLIVRRSLGQVFERLALRLPTLEDVLYGIGTAVLCLILIMVFSAVLTLVFSPESLEAQGAASEQIARALGGSLILVFLAAFAAAVGEEILFRGALQPVFGLIPTTIFFALLHSQYAFTPGSAAILVVGGAFGWLKQRHSTTAAIIAHFTYNFTLLSFAYLYLQLEEAGLLPETTESIIYFTSLILHN